MNQKVVASGNKNHLVAANVKFRRNSRQERYVEIITSKESDEGEIMVVEKKTLPKWDMALIGGKRPKFSSNDFNQSLYTQCLFHPEGRRALNDLKNSLTNKAVNSYLSIIKKEIKPDVNKIAQGHVPTMKTIINMFEKTPISGNNLLSHEVIGLTKGQIWEMFKSIGLVEKIKNTVI